MPIWEVSEPYINLWLYDTPMSYRPGIGNSIAFKLDYKQRETRTISASLFGFGPQWDCSWLSYIIDDGVGNTATMEIPNGGERTYVPDNVTKEYYSHTVLQRTTNGSGNLTGFILSYADGAKDYYQFIPGELLNAQQVAFLTSKVDPYGHATRFVYQDAGGLALLLYVIDTDGRTNTLSYANPAYPAQVTGVQDPFGNSVSLQYNNNSGVLTNVTDVVGMKSSFQYDANWAITNLITPYGSTKFEYFTNTFAVDDNIIIRSIRVVDAVGGTNLYVLRQDSSALYTPGGTVSFIPFSYDSSVVPSGVPTPTIDNDYLYRRDSFHWGPKQASGLPADITTFGVSDYLKARMRHWLHGGGGSGIDFWTISQDLDMEQDPSPDGVTMGQTTWYDYDGKGASYMEGTDSRPSSISRVLPDGTTWYTWYQRDQWGRATNVVTTYSSGYGAAPMTRTNAYVYSPSSGDLIAQIGPQGETWSSVYDANHNLLKATDPLGQVTTQTYDAQGRLTGIRTPAGLTTTNIYFASGPYTNWLQTTIDLEIQRTNSYTYANDLVYSHTDERGLTVTFTWDALRRLRRVDFPDGTFITNSYNRLDLVRIIDRMGYTNSFGYDAVRRLIAQTNALGNYTLYNYCPCGALESIQDAAGNFTAYTYDNAGRLLTAAYPDSYTVSYQYDLLGQLTNTVDSAGTSITNWYNNQGLRYAASNAFGQVFAFTFDADDRIVDSVDVNGVSHSMNYDALGRMTSLANPDGGVEWLGYSPRGGVAYTNQLGQANYFAYDAARRKTAETNANNEVTWFSYNTAGDLLTFTDGKGQTTRWGYDAYGRMTNKVDAANNVLFVYQYDSDNRLTNRWSAAKGATAYSYDAVGNLTHIAYPSSTAISLGYDMLDRLTNMVDAVGVTHYNYDTVGQLLNEDGPWTNDIVSYTYQNRLRTGLSLQQPGVPSWSQSYGYDSARRLTSVASPAGGFNYMLGGAGAASPLVKKLLLPNGACITNIYDDVARLTGTYLLDNHGNYLNVHAYVNNVGNQRIQQSFTAGDYVSYGYDNIGQLKTATGRESGGTIRLNEEFGYTYDAAHNLYHRANNALMQTFNVNTLNELTTASRSGTFTAAGTTTSPATNVTVNALNAFLYNDATFAKDGFTLADGNNTFTAVAKDIWGRQDTTTLTAYLPATVSFTYDLNGNLLSDGNRTFAYDDENELTSVWVTNIWRSDFVYDGKLRRRMEKDYSWNGSTWAQTNEVHYVYDVNLVIQERNSNNLPQVTYTRGKDLSGSLQGAGGIGGLLARSLFVTNYSVDNVISVTGAGIAAANGSYQYVLGLSSFCWTNGTYTMTNAWLASPPYWAISFGNTREYHMPGNSLGGNWLVDAGTSPAPTVTYGSNTVYSNAYYHADGNGNITCLINSNQVVVARYRYDPFGNTLSISGSMADANTYRFSSKEWNANAGLYYYLYRFYDPNLQRWLNRDPIEELGGINLYGYIANAPINNIDKDGFSVFGGLPPGGISGPFRPKPTWPSPVGIGISLASAALTYFDDCSGKCPASACNSCCQNKYLALTALNVAGAGVGCIGSGGILCIGNIGVSILVQLQLNKDRDDCKDKCQSSNNSH